MVNRYATQAGKKYESDLMKYLRTHGYDVERLRLSGAEDEGDLLLRSPAGRLVIEAKRTKGLDLAGWVKEALLERDNYMAHRDWKVYTKEPQPGFVVFHHAKGKSIDQGYATTTIREFIRLVT